MINLSKAKVGDKFITRNGVVVEYHYKQSRCYGTIPHHYIIDDFVFTWPITPDRYKFLHVNKFGLENPPFEGKWDIVKQVPKTELVISIF